MFISFNDRFDRRFSKSSSFLVVTSDSFVTFHCFTLGRSIDFCSPYSSEIFQQFEYFPVALPARFKILAVSQSLELLSLYLMSELGFIFLVCWDVSGIMIGCVVVVDVCVDVNDCDGAMDDCEDAVDA